MRGGRLKEKGFSSQKSLRNVMETDKIRNKNDFSLCCLELYGGFYPCFTLRSKFVIFQPRLQTSFKKAKIPARNFLKKSEIVFNKIIKVLYQRLTMSIAALWTLKRK